MKLFTTLILSLCILSLKSQTCTPNANCARGDFIDDFNFDNGAINSQNSRGSNCGFPWNPGASYRNTGLSASVTEDSLYSFSIGSGNTAQFFAIWVDWNRDNDFDDADEFVYTSSVASTSVNGSFRSPRGITPGAAAMRVRSRRSTAFVSSNSCISVPFGETEDYRLNQTSRFAPIADFTASSTSPSINCPIQFENRSTGFANNFTWDFGDGQSSGLENPSHSYSASGSYTVKLTVSNSIGSDVEEKVSFINVGSSSGPVNPTCSPSGSAVAAGFGIVSTSFAGSTKLSVDANALGYEDFSCSPISVIQGQTYNLVIKSNTSALQNYRVWVDWNGDGFLSNTNELVYSANDLIEGNASIAIPQTALLNTAIRMRISAVYSLTAPLNNNFDACSNLSNGQIEDYGLSIKPNTNAPIANFESDVQNSCDGRVEFYDKSSFVPSSWLWDFGDGGSSNQPNPVHNYSSNGSYAVKLTVTNSFGSNNITKFNYITVNGNNLTKTTCAVQTQSHISDYGIYSFSLNAISNASSGGEMGYEDFSCEQNTSLLRQQQYAVEVRTGSNNNEDLKLWVDLNDDGSFTASELLMTSLNKSFHVDSITLPASTTIGKALRLRISSDFVGANIGPCDDPTFGQVEDYSVTVLNNPNAVSADFDADSTTSCTGVIQFSDLSTNNPSTWLWNFGDGNTSNFQNPKHTYLSDGSYSVSLIVSKNGASDTLVKSGFIAVDQQVCKPVTMPENGQGTVMTSCAGKLFDSGGRQDYASNTFGIQSISPSNASSVELEFQRFIFGSGDYLKIYDGPDTNSSLIGLYTGTSIAPGSKIVGSSGSLTLVQFSNASINGPGFEASWICEQIPSRPVAFFNADSTESCTGFIKFSDLSTNTPNSWNWNFGDGNTSNQKNPTHFYSNQGKYSIRLIVSNTIGSDTLLKTNYVEVNNAFCSPESIEEVNLLEELVFFPNPSSGLFHFVSTEASGLTDILVFDSRGRVVFNQRIDIQPNERNEINLEHQSSGLYFVRLKSDTWVSQKKLRIE